MKMKKIIILSFAAVIAVAGCKKQHTTISNVVTASYPTVTVTGSPYVSIPVGGTFVPPNATAYDSFYHEKLTVVKNLGALDNTTAGLYVLSYTAKNSYGFEGSTYVYVAVTNIPDTLNLAGVYIRNGSLHRIANVTKLATGLFMTDNVGGADITDSVNTGPRLSAIFAVTSPATLTFGSQTTRKGPLSSFNESLSLVPSDTTMTYNINEQDFGSTVVRTFVKQ